MCEVSDRISIEYKNLSQKFSKTKKEYNKQFCSIYLVRLEKMRNVLYERIKEKWGDQYPLLKLFQLAEEKEDACVVIGTLFKNQKLKPSVLKQLAEANQLLPQPILSHFTDESDQLFIEDELQRYQLLGNVKIDDLVTGITCALLGHNMGKGKFMVDDLLFADFQTQIERPILEQDCFILLLSGLDFLRIQKCQINLQLLVCWLTGLFDRDNAAKVARVIIAGNSVKTETEVAKPRISMTSRVPESSETIDAVKLLDAWLSQLSQVVEVDVMPGQHDPSNHILPQKQMHHCMFPLSAKYKSLNQVSNPYLCKVGGVQLLGTSGQPVLDILRYSEIKAPIEALENCLKWDHLAPTAPDTLGCFPFYEEDPFIIEECPHVLFAGNQEKFDTKIATGNNGQSVRLICVPEFSNSFQVCLLNLKNLDCKPMVFST